MHYDDLYYLNDFMSCNFHGVKTGHVRNAIVRCRSIQALFVCFLDNWSHSEAQKCKKRQKHQFKERRFSCHDHSKLVSTFNV